MLSAGGDAVRKFDLFNYHPRIILERKRRMGRDLEGLCLLSKE
jgi:hypothetical protein